MLSCAEDPHLLSQSPAAQPLMTERNKHSIPAEWQSDHVVLLRPLNTNGETLGRLVIKLPPESTYKTAVDTGNDIITAWRCAELATTNATVVCVTYFPPEMPEQPCAVRGYGLLLTSDFNVK
jgi:hypothetical protein